MLFGCGEGFRLEKLATISVCKSRLTHISLSPDLSTIAAVSNTTVFILTEQQRPDSDTTEWTVSGKFKVRRSSLSVHINTIVFMVLVVF